MSNERYSERYKDRKGTFSLRKLCAVVVFLGLGVFIGVFSAKFFASKGSTSAVDTEYQVSTSAPEESEDVESEETDASDEQEEASSELDDLRERLEKAEEEIRSEPVVVEASQAEEEPQGSPASVCSSSLNESIAAADDVSTLVGQLAQADPVQYKQMSSLANKLVEKEMPELATEVGELFQKLEECISSGGDLELFNKAKSAVEAIPVESLQDEVDCLVQSMDSGEAYDLIRKHIDDVTSAAESVKVELSNVTSILGL